MRPPMPPASRTSSGTERNAEYYAFMLDQLGATESLR